MIFPMGTRESTVLWRLFNDRREHSRAVILPGGPPHTVAFFVNNTMDRVENYDTLAALSPRPGDSPVIALLTPGVFNSAYFEHAYLAQAMGIELVEGSDLFVADDDCTYMRTVYGPKRVDVVYRRVDDLFIDPEVFHPDSVLGVPGLIMVPATPEWRYGARGPSMPWYSSIRLFRQGEDANWSGVVDEVAREARARLGA